MAARPRRHLRPAALALGCYAGAAPAAAPRPASASTALVPMAEDSLEDDIDALLQLVASIDDPHAADDEPRDDDERRARANSEGADEEDDEATSIARLLMAGQQQQQLQRARTRV